MSPEEKEIAVSNSISSRGSDKILAPPVGMEPTTSPPPLNLASADHISFSNEIYDSPRDFGPSPEPSEFDEVMIE
ncbi:hypothetical protein RUM43_000559 [Polyplax serrata]|uniref:Uncharacterized protein n=1 Tax=Polyplax serrata TaxID=468196 RepID=A0AAN8XSH2_POLSC